MIKQKLQTQQGFTLLELLVVLSIIALLAGVVVPKSIEYLDDSKIKTTRLQIEELSAALDMYKLDVGSYPKTDQGEHGKFDLFSLGGDGQEGGEGSDQDITSWEE